MQYWTGQNRMLLVKSGENWVTRFPFFKTGWYRVIQTVKLSQPSQDMDGDQVTVEISGTEEKSNSNGEIEVEAIEKEECGRNIEVVELNQESGLRSRKKVPSFMSIEIPKSNLITLQQLNVDDTKPKSGLGETTIPSNLKNDKVGSTTVSPFESPKPPKVSPPVTPRTPLLASPRQDDDDLTKDNQIGKWREKIKFLFVIELNLLFVIEITSFVFITLVLILSQIVNELKKREIWSLDIWRWCVLALAILCGRMFSEWLINVIVFLIEKGFLLKRKVVYFVYGLQKSVHLFLWLGLILVAWVLLIKRGARRSKDRENIINYITRGIASTLVVAGAWIFRSLLEKILASSFHIKRFFKRIQENIFSQYVLQTLSGPPVMFGDDSHRFPSRQSEDVIDVQKLQKMKPEKASAWTMRLLIEVIGKPRSSDAIEENEDGFGWYPPSLGEITTEFEAQRAGRFIFRNISMYGSKYIERHDLLRFLDVGEVDKVLALIGGAVETQKIKKKSLINWVVNVYKERKYLVQSLKDTKTALKELNKFITGLTVVLLIILWIILMGIATTEVLLFISSQVLLAVFSFGATAKSAMEAMIFVFLKHPFDVGDRCVIDGVQVVVEEVSILTTVFLRYDNEKIYYPNSVLATKIISNFNRSPDMSDSVEFDLDVSTSIQNISILKDKIEEYIDSKAHLWHPDHSVSVREIEDANKMKMSLYVTHTINFQDFKEKRRRRSKLILKLKNIFEKLEIKYHILPQLVMTGTC